jgi:MSHA biogenesis protein MshJ
MMKQYWEKISVKIDALSIRERVLVFATVVILALSLINTLLLEPLMARQKLLRNQISQQQQQMNEVQSQIALLLQENSPNSNSPQRTQLNQFKQEIAEGSAFLKSNRESLIQPEKMAEHLRRMLSRNNRLQLVALQTLAVTPLIEQQNDTSQNSQNQNSKKSAQFKGDQATVSAVARDKQVFKHGVQLTLRGNYPDLMQYLADLERLPQQMFWARAKMSVVQYPTVELTLILYTLSLDKTWMQI